jgi:imidazolonepropionase-like amidohydrolase
MSTGRVAIKAGRIIDGTGRSPIERGIVVIEGERIAAVGSQAEVIDCATHTLLPGVVDAHSHASIVPGLGDQIGQLRQPPQ